MSRRVTTKTVTKKYNRRKYRPFRRIARSMISKNPIHHFKRWSNVILYDSNFPLDPPIVNAGNESYVLMRDNEVFLSLQFAFNAIENYTEFTNLYDQYRINKVVLCFFNTANVNQLQPNTAGTTPPSTLTLPVRYVIDYDDKNVPDGGVLDEYARQRFVRFPKDVKISLVPAIQSVISRDDSVVNIYAGSPKFKQWISTDAPEIQHFGVKMCIPGVGAPVGSTETGFRYQVKVCYYFSCKNVK